MITWRLVMKNYIKRLSRIVLAVLIAITVATPVEAGLQLKSVYETLKRNHWATLTALTAGAGCLYYFFGPKKRVQTVGQESLWQKIWAYCFSRGEQEIDPIEKIPPKE